MLEHPYIDFDGDGHGDSYDTVATPGGQEYVHHDHHGHIDAIAYDHNGDGLMDTLKTDDNHDGSLDNEHRDTNGDGIMDDSGPIVIDYNDPVAGHPYIDFDGDGHGDRYYSTADGRTDMYDHVDGHGHVDARALDHTGEGLIDEMYVDRDHDGAFDTLLEDRNGDGIMDTARRI
jgi:hypothetical protein